MYKHILIPTDGSKLSSRAIQHALAIAKLDGSRVTGLFVAPAPSPLAVQGSWCLCATSSPISTRRSAPRPLERYLGEIEAAAQAAGVRLRSA